MYFHQIEGVEFIHDHDNQRQTFLLTLYMIFSKLFVT